MSIAPIILCVALFRVILFVCLFAFVRACACECVGDHNETSIDSRIDKGAWSKRRMEDRAHWCIPWWLWLSCVINDVAPPSWNYKTCPGCSSANLILNFGGHVLKSPKIIHSIHVCIYIYCFASMYLLFLTFFDSPFQGKTVAESPVDFFKFYHRFWLNTHGNPILEHFKHPKKKNIVFSNKLHKQSHTHLNSTLHSYNTIK